MLRALRIQGLRNLAVVDVVLEPGVTVFMGANGAGKTALLESVYVLSRGRSFRGRRHGALVQHGFRRARVEGWVDSNGVVERVTWEMEGGAQAEWGARADGPGHGRATRLSVRLICDATSSLVEGEPAMRRRFVDWNVFHVEPAFSDVRARYRRLSGQRTAWLRSGGGGPAVWDRPYAEALVAVARARQRFMDRLSEAFRRLCQEVGWYEELSLEWRSSLSSVDALVGRLREAREADVQRGFTSVSGSRDDFRLLQGGRRWVGSRGESKVVGVLLQLAGQAVVEESGGPSAVWLVDDLAAELSDESCHRLFAAIQQRAPQVLLTALPGKAPRSFASMFHVEQGAVELIRPHLRAIAQ